MDALPPAQPAYVYAATDERPRGAREVELCEKASHVDWLYWGGSAAAFAFATYANFTWIKQAEQPGVRLLGPAGMGLTWGFFVGGGYLAQPKCSPDWVTSAPAEGDVRATWPLAISLALLAGVTAPLLDYYAIGPVPAEWPVAERTGRIFVAGGSAFFGALLPYVLPPRTWSGAQELQRIRAGVEKNSAFVSYSLSF